MSKFPTRHRDEGGGKARSVEHQEVIDWREHR